MRTAEETPIVGAAVSGRSREYSSFSSTHSCTTPVAAPRYSRPSVPPSAKCSLTVRLCRRRRVLSASASIGAGAAASGKASRDAPSRALSCWDGSGGGGRGAVA